MGKNFSKMKSWEQTALLKATAWNDEEEETEKQEDKDATSYGQIATAATSTISTQSGSFTKTLWNAPLMYPHQPTPLSVLVRAVPLTPFVEGFTYEITVDGMYVPDPDAYAWSSEVIGVRVANDGGFSEMERLKEELREANWKIKILEGVLTELGYCTEEE